MVDTISTGVDVAAAQRASMLRMGQNWQKLGKLNQAIATYLRIVEDNPGAQEAEAAKAALLTIATGFEQEGRYHLAISIYDRLNASLA
jgi:tetratricopeptide (TPR) repeat protein